MIITLANCIIPECGGADHRWEFVRPTLREIERIETATGMDMDTWASGMEEAFDGRVGSAMVRSTLALVDILHRRIGVRVPFEDVDVDIASLDIEFEDGETDDEDQADETDGAQSDEGKGPAPTEPSHQPADEESAVAASGDATEEESEPKSSPTPTASGDGSASP